MLTAGTRIGPFEIVAPIGAGGMGEVYRARDLAHELEWIRDDGSASGARAMAAGFAWKRVRPRLEALLERCLA